MPHGFVPAPAPQQLFETRCALLCVDHRLGHLCLLFRCPCQTARRQFLKKSRENLPTAESSGSSSCLGCYLFYLRIYEGIPYGITLTFITNEGIIIFLSSHMHTYFRHILIILLLFDINNMIFCYYYDYDILIIIRYQ